MNTAAHSSVQHWRAGH
uniref:Uncharacterized protein n=1 Tax=Anguilla anguilla TaxID=7936 RepID=A0A0E9PW11_ANGAN